MRHLIALLALVAVCSGCSRPLHTRFEPAVHSAEATEIWSRHVEAIEASQQGTFNEYEFGNAIQFFWEVTGIKIAIDMNYFGLMPTEETLKDFSKVSAWYERHEDFLSFDPESGAVFVQPVGCRSDSQSGEQSARSIQAKRLWDEHEQAVADALRGGGNPSRFRPAYDFFQDLTRIGISFTIEDDHFLPDPQEGANDFRRVVAWGQRNRERLVLDRRTGQVEIQRCSVWDFWRG